ncbi:GGDEF domain-containing protein [Desulfurobacterium sp. TC5-1]|uniref:GGDEF domain-containing protein n=1 Tax=Desulfurobacterium sp. TC5-1 TaxID=1158318 RepID=UPI0003B35287|nr:GGDEF domain-containing protein [Desulfurobacterium sp. TC5-1]
MCNWNFILLSFRCKDRNRFYERCPHRKRFLNTVLNLTPLLVPVIVIFPAYLFGKPLMFKFGVFSFLLSILAKFVYSIGCYFFSAVTLILSVSLLCFGIVVQGEHFLYMWFAVVPGLAFLILPYADAAGAIATFLSGIFILILKYHHHPVSTLLYYTLNLIGFISIISLGAFILMTVIDDTFEMLKESSIKDPLTQAYNRRAFMEFIKEEIARAKRYRFPISLIMIDIDDFKKVNDTYGHAKGDEVLKKMAALIMTSIRRCDKLVRWGGEEFVVICPHLSKREAYFVAEKLRKIIASHDFNGVKVTASFGVSEIDPSDSIDRAVKLADKALYEAKKSGKNSVKVYVEEEDSGLIFD